MSGPPPGHRLAAVTGATGFLGQHLVRALGDAGWRVRILARKDPVSPFWRGLAPQVVIGDLSNAPALARLCAGADVVIHNAGLIAGTAAQFQAVNVDGARAVAQAALDAGVARTVLISSLAAREPQLSPYAASKRGGEDAAHEVLGRRLTVARPPAVYGPGDRETFRLFQVAAKSPVLPVLDPAGRVAVIHAEDAARQIAELAAGGPPGVFALADGCPQGYSWQQLMIAASEASGRKTHLVRLPSASLYAMAFTDSFSSHWRRTPPLLTFGKVAELTFLDWGIRQGERAPSPPAAKFDLSSGFRQTIAWYRSQGWL